MKRPWFVPSPIALLSAVLVFMLLGGVGVVAAAVVPHLLELMKTSPRLAMLGFLGLVVSPAFVVVIVHHIGHRALDRVDRGAGGRSVLPRARSWWAGAHAWLVLYGTSVLTSLVMLVLFPPEPEPDLVTIVSGVLQYATIANVASIHSVIWIAIAAELYELERRTRRQATED